MAAAPAQGPLVLCAEMHGVGSELSAVAEGPCRLGSPLTDRPLKCRLKRDAEGKVIHRQQHHYGRTFGDHRVKELYRPRNSGK